MKHKSLLCAFVIIVVGWYVVLPYSYETKQLDMYIQYNTWEPFFSDLTNKDILEFILECPEWNPHFLVKSASSNGLWNPLKEISSQYPKVKKTANKGIS